MKPLFVETLVMLRVLAATSLSLTVLTLNALGALAQPSAMVETIKFGEVEAAQEAWCDAPVAFSRAHAKGGLRVKQPSVKLVRDQFHISSEITQPSTILASRLEPLVSS